MSARTRFGILPPHLFIFFFSNVRIRTGTCRYLRHMTALSLLDAESSSTFLFVFFPLKSVFAFCILALSHFYFPCSQTRCDSVNSSDDSNTNYMLSTAQFLQPKSWTFPSFSSTNVPIWFPCLTCQVWCLYFFSYSQPR